MAKNILQKPGTIITCMLSDRFQKRQKLITIITSPGSSCVASCTVKKEVMGLNTVEGLNLSQRCLQRPLALFSSHSCGQMYIPLTYVYMLLTLLLMCGSILSLDFSVQPVIDTAKRYCSYTCNEDKSIYLDRRVHTCDSYPGSVCYCY